MRFLFSTISLFLLSVFQLSHIFFSHNLFSIAQEITTKSVVHCLIAADTLCNLKEASQKDRQIIFQLMDLLANSGCKVKTSCLQGKELKAISIERWISNEKIGKKDTAIFYYSGHGVQNWNGQTPWPMLALQNGRQFVNSDTVISSLRKKNPRLLVVITDCCNSPPFEMKSLSAPRSHLYRQELSQLSIFLKKLFLNTRGIISITASRPGSYAIGSSAYGGLLTNAFFFSIFTESTKNYSSWHTVLKSTHEICSSINQVPYYEIAINDI